MNKLLFFDKEGNPLNFKYDDANQNDKIIDDDNNFIYKIDSNSNIAGIADFSNLESSNKINLNIKDANKYDISKWANKSIDFIKRGATINLKISVLSSSNVINAEISDISIVGNEIIINFFQYSGSPIINIGKKIYIEVNYKNKPGGFYKGYINIPPVSAGLIENYQIFILQEFKDSMGNIKNGYPHKEIEINSKSKWRTRWENDSYGNIDIKNIIFTYKVIENDEELGSPVIYNYPNIVYEIVDSPTDFYEGGYVITENNIENALSINVAVNAINSFADVYERRLIIEELVEERPIKIAEIDFYAEIIGEDERLDILTKNLGRAFNNEDSLILRDHDINEPFPDYIEINEKRKELLVAGEEIFPYIGSYRGLINAMRFFGYQDLRIKEYWLNIDYKDLTLSTNAIKLNQDYLDNTKEGRTRYSPTVLISDIIDNPNSGKYTLSQTYGPDKDGIYKLDTSQNRELLSKEIYKKTAMFGLYYDINRTTNKTDPYGYPITEEVYLFSMEEVLIKLFGLKERLKKSYLPLNARIIDITGEGVYYYIYNTRVWTDSTNRLDVEIGFTPKISIFPKYGFIQDLSLLNTRKSKKAIQLPSNYNNKHSLNFIIQQGNNKINIEGENINNPIISFYKGNIYTINNINIDSRLFITKNNNRTLNNPIGIVNNGAGLNESIIIEVHPEEQDNLYYFVEDYPESNGIIEINEPNISDFGNTIDPLKKLNKLDKFESDALIKSIKNFYLEDNKNKILNHGDNKYDPEIIINPDLNKPIGKKPIGMPVILNLDLYDPCWNDLNLTWSSIQVPLMRKGDSILISGEDITGDNSFINETGEIIEINYSTGIYKITTSLGIREFDEGSFFSPRQNYSSLSWSNIKFSNYTEIEWIIKKTEGDENKPYNFNFKGPILDFYSLPHFLPYLGKYTITCHVFDSYNYRSTAILNDIIEVDSKNIVIDSWTRYNKSEIYDWDNMKYSWNDYRSIWENVAEGLTFEEANRKLFNDILSITNYNESVYSGKRFKVKSKIPGKNAYGIFKLEQDDIKIESIKSLKILGTHQYTVAIIKTVVPHNFKNNSIIYIKNSIPALNGEWRIEIPQGFDEYSMTIRKVLDQEQGTIYSVNQIEVDNILYPDQKITGGGEIKIYINNKKILELETKENLKSTSHSIVSSINKIYTSPDYIASLNLIDQYSGEIKISASDAGITMNGLPIKIETTGSIKLIYSDSYLSGGTNEEIKFVEWNENDKNFPVEKLKYWGTSDKIKWDYLDSEIIWDDFYSQSWNNFEYNNDYLGGYEIFNIKHGDKIKIISFEDKEVQPFIFNEDSTKLSLVANQLNNSDNKEINNFHYRVFPSSKYNEFPSISKPQEIEFIKIVPPPNTYPVPDSVENSDISNKANFTYSK